MVDAKIKLEPKSQAHGALNTVLLLDLYDVIKSRYPHTALSTDTNRVFVRGTYRVGSSVKGRGAAG